jgi:hypothetical protein
VCAAQMAVMSSRLPRQGRSANRIPFSLLAFELPANVRCRAITGGARFPTRARKLDGRVQGRGASQGRSRDNEHAKQEAQLEFGHVYATHVVTNVSLVMPQTSMNVQTTERGKCVVVRADKPTSGALVNLSQSASRSGRKVAWEIRV